MEEFGGYGDGIEAADVFQLDPVAVAARAARLNVFQRQITTAQQLVTQAKENNAGRGHVKKLERLLSSIIGILEEDRVPDESIESSTSACLQQLLQSELLPQLCEACLPNSPVGTRRLLIETLGTLLRQVRARVLMLGILKPLNVTVTTVCLKKQSQLQEGEEYLQVVLLNELCSRFTSDTRLVPLFFDEGLVKTNAKGDDTFVFPVFTSLIRFMHEPGPTGSLARDTLLMCVGKLPHVYPSIDGFVVESSNFCQMLVAGLSAFYAGLPTQNNNCKGEKRLNVDSMPQLQTFLEYLEFCDAVTLCTSDAITFKLVQLVNSEFASPILRPALLQTTAAEALAATLYLDLILARITHSTLATPFVDLILDTPHEQVTAYEEYMLKVLLRRILSKDVKVEGELCLATIRLFITLFNLNREDVFEHLCIKPLLDIPQVSLSVVSPDHVDSDVIAIHAARSFLELRCALFESTQDGPDFTDFEAQARIEVNKRHKACAHWTKQYSVADLKVAVEHQSSKKNPGSPHRINWSPSKVGSLRPTNNHTGLWGVLMEKLRHINSHKLKTNLLLTQLISTLVQYTSPLWASFVFTLDISKAHATVATLYGVLSQLSYEADNIENTQVSFQAELKSARDSTHSSRSMVPSVGDANKHVTEPHCTDIVTPSPNPERESTASSTLTTTTTTATATPATTVTAPTSAGYFSSWMQTMNKVVLPQPITSPTKSFQNLSLSLASRLTTGANAASLQQYTSALTEKQKRVKPKLKTVNGVLIFEEFLKELAAIAFEHALLSPLPD